MEIDYRFVLDNLSAFVYITDRAGKYLYANQRLCDFFGVTPQEIVGCTDFDFFDAPTARAIRENDQRVILGKMTVSVEEPATVDGERRSFWSVKIPLFDAAGEVYGLLGITTDITEMARAREKLRVAAQVFAQSQEGIFVATGEGLIVEVNDAFCDITGYRHGAVSGQLLSLLQDGGATGDLLEIGRQTFATQGRWRGEVSLRREDGTSFPAVLSLAVVRDDQGASEKLIGVFSDITQLKQQQQALEALAYHDALTQLPNRVLFADRIVRAMGRARRDQRLLGVCYLDLDGFKQVNDAYGHETGDALLIEVAQRIRQTLREEDTVSRLGGDEFAVLLEGLETESHCRRAVERLQRSIIMPYRLRGHSITIGVSIGITLYPRDEGDVDALLRHADQAMYRAKSAGRNRYCFFDSGDAVSALGAGAV